MRAHEVVADILLSVSAAPTLKLFGVVSSKRGTKPFRIIAEMVPGSVMGDTRTSLPRGRLRAPKKCKSLLCQLRPHQHIPLPSCYKIFRNTAIQTAPDSRGLYYWCDSGQGLHQPCCAQLHPKPIVEALVEI